MEALKRIEMENGSWEVGFAECDGEDPSMICYVEASGSTPAEFFGGAVVEGIDEEGDLRRDWYVGSKRCLFRETAIEYLIEFWTLHFGAIARFEVDRILAEAHPEKPKS